MRARIATKILSGLYEDVPTLLTSAIRLMVELPGGKNHSGPPYPFTIGVSPAWCSGLNGAKLVASGKLDLVWLNPSIIPSMAVRGVGPFKNKSPLRALAVFPSWDRLVIAVSPRLGVNSMRSDACGQKVASGAEPVPNRTRPCQKRTAPRKSVRQRSLFDVANQFASISKRNGSPRPRA